MLQIELPIVLPEHGYNIYTPEFKVKFNQGGPDPVRDLLRKRGHLVRLRTSLINSLQGIISRNCGCCLSGNKMKQLRENHVAPLLAGQEDLALSGEVSKETIDFLSGQISRIEALVLKKVKLRKSFQCLQSMPGVGKILSLTIMLETGKIDRFPNVGDFSSYCRKVPANWISKKKKGKGNTKNESGGGLLCIGLGRQYYLTHLCQDKLTHLVRNNQ